jgi:F0F1-type ATP synthase membrane subunit b/b'
MFFENFTPSRLLLPVLLLSFAFVGFLFFQTNLLLTDRAALKTAYSEQSKTLEQVEKVRTQVSALVKGVMDLSQKGNRNAKTIVSDLKKAGVNFEDQPPPTAAGSAVPTPPAAPAEAPKR